MNGMNNMMGNGMNNMMGNGMMNNGISNNGLYVPKSNGVSIASIIQNKKQGGSGVTNNGGNQMGGHVGSQHMHDTRSQNVDPRQRAAASAYGFDVDQNGYPIPLDKRGDPQFIDNRNINSRNMDGRNMDNRNMDGRRVNEQHPDTRSIDSRGRDPRMDPNSDTNSEYERIMELANDVNNSLEVLEENEKRKRSKKRREIETDSESTDSIRSTGSRNKKTTRTTKTKDNSDNSENNTENDAVDNSSDSITNIIHHGYGMMVIEPLLLLTIYVILSQPFAISFTSHYIDQLNPNEDGSIQLSGIIIYGFILVLMFLVLRKVIEWKLEQ